MKKSKGFTLVEVMVVVAIIVILAGILVPKVTGYIKEVKKTEVINEAREIVTAVEVVNVKRNNVIRDEDSVSNAIGKIKNMNEDLLKDKSFEKLSPTTTKIKDCRNVVDTERYEIKLDENNKLESVSPIGKN